MKKFHAALVVLVASGAGLAAQAAFAADIEAGRALVEATNCAACHGARLNNPVSDAYPKLAGQHADYTYYALRQYQMGNANPAIGRDNAIMRAQVQGMSESDLRNMAAYIASLSGDLTVRK
ncbi:c-type cytochrome [Robbsia sp. Bb-Pol-6]|uniref:C-type cytochrome n=1 Tax=Robbsia betulipollinis TaxID=2981849 RepID=A0ABT3ZPV8_9BURK|nr:c-type cytochrome [Robbsia betulipollinis]MCY0388584.1 c-type cytochrome [Robbsia betulipollinis]